MRKRNQKFMSFFSFFLSIFLRNFCRFSSLVKPRTIRSRNRLPRRFPHSRPHPLRWLLSPVILSTLSERVARDRSSAEIAEDERVRESGGWIASEDPRSSRTRSFTGVSFEFHVLFDVGAKFQTGPRKLQLLSFQSLGRPPVRDGHYE